MRCKFSLPFSLFVNILCWGIKKLFVSSYPTCPKFPPSLTLLGPWEHRIQCLTFAIKNPPKITPPTLYMPNNTIDSKLKSTNLFKTFLFEFLRHKFAVPFIAWIFTFYGKTNGTIAHHLLWAFHYPIMEFQTYDKYYFLSRCLQQSDCCIFIIRLKTLS